MIFDSFNELSKNVLVHKDIQKNYNYKFLCEYFAPYVCETTDFLVDILRLDQTQKIILHPIEDNAVAGSYCPDTNLVLIDPRQPNVSRMALVIAHECLHARQRKDGRLRYENGSLVWYSPNNNLQYTLPSAAFAANADHHPTLPWEIDARQQERELYNNMRKKFKYLIPYSKLRQI